MEVRFNAENGTKSIIVANIVTLLLAISTSIWTVAKMNQRIAEVERRQTDIAELVRLVQVEQSDQSERITHLESVQSSIVADVDRLEGFHFNKGATDGFGIDRADPRPAGSGLPGLQEAEDKRQEDRRPDRQEQGPVRAQGARDQEE